jgi:hypothetical protein
MGWLGRLSLANDPEYAALKNDISTLKKQLKGSEDTPRLLNAQGPTGNIPETKVRSPYQFHE